MQVNSLFYRFLSTSNQFNETIYALSSGQGKSGVAIIRISGKDCKQAILKLLNRSTLLEPRYAYLSKIYNPVTKELLDKGLVLWFPGPNSFTGEDVCEFQVHGGTAIISSMLQSLGTLNNFRLARPGEFTKRAFYNKKLDLVEAEGLADLINAETEMQRKQALIQSQGLLSRTYIRWKDQLTVALTNFESLFNFENIDDSNDDEIQKNVNNVIKEIHSEINEHLNDGKRGQLLRNGVKTAIIGEPNVGKSSLYNFLCKKKAAIVTPYPGTTRDTLENYIDLFGYPVILYDTCGIRYRDVNLIEAEGVQVTLDTIKSSELLLLVIDAEKFHVWLNNTEKGNLLYYVKDYIINDLQVPDIINRSATDLLSLFRKRCLIVINKIDKIQVPTEDDENVSCVSVSTNAGLEGFLKNINKKLKDICAEPSTENPAITKVRHRVLLETCQNSLNQYLEMVENKDNLDYAILANHLRCTLRALTEMIEGRRDNSPVTEILDEIFHNFCVGK
ncbi:hypothetical protein Trydic_g21081 [Trypoxylus dichotomus]